MADIAIFGWMSVPQYPEFVPLSLDLRDELHPIFANLPDGVSEYTFGGLYLFRKHYGYRISRIGNGQYALSGTRDGKSFFCLPTGLPADSSCVQDLLDRHDYLKGLAERFADDARIRLESHGYGIVEDRDNFDYLYRVDDLADLPGRRYHKKRNQVNGFVRAYEYEHHELSRDNCDDAAKVLDHWKRERERNGEDEGDYPEAREALELMEALELRGSIVYVDGEPVAYTMGEALAQGESFVIHVEKANSRLRGVYQFVNQAFASLIRNEYKLINREQDLGDGGLRQAKMTYRPAGFVKKYKVLKAPELLAWKAAQGEQAQAELDASSGS